MNDVVQILIGNQIPGKCCLPWTSHGALLWISFYSFLMYFPSKIPEAKNLKQKLLSETSHLLGGRGSHIKLMDPVLCSLICCQYSVS